MRAEPKHLLLSAIAVSVLMTGCARTPAQQEERSLERGKRLVERHDYQRAVLEFSNAIKAVPTDAEPVYELAMTYIEMRDFRTAYALLKKCVSINPAFAKGEIALAKFESGASDKSELQQARQRLQQVLIASPNNADALNTLAALDFRAGNSDAAVQSLEAAVERSPADLLATINLAKLKRKQNDEAGAEGLLKKLIQNAPRSAEARLALANFYLTAGKRLEAKAEIQRAVNIDPKNASALVLLAELEAQAGDRSQAEETCRLISALPDDALKPTHAIFFFQEGKRDLAIAELANLWKQNRNDRKIRTLLVSWYIETGNTQEAQRILDGTLKQNPKDIDALLQRSQLFLDRGKLAETEADLRSVLSFSPGSAEAHYGLARIAAVKGSTLIQQQELNAAIQSDPRLLSARIDLAAALLIRKDPRSAMDVLNDAPPSQKQMPEYLIERNWVLFALKNKSELQAELKAQLAHNRLPEFLYQQALLKFSEKDYSDARALLEELLKTRPEDMSALDLLGKTYSAEGNSSKGLDVIERYASQRPNSPLLGSLVGIWQSNNGKLAEARQSFLKVTTANPAYMPGRLALTDVDLALGNLVEAQEILHKTLSAEPANIDARIRMAQVEGRMGNRNAAQDDLRLVVQSQPNNPLALKGLAYFLADGRPDEALRYAQSAVELVPQDPVAQDILGWVYYRKNLYDSALSCFKTAAAKQPTAEHKYHLALAYAKMGDKHLADENLKAALQLNPKLQMPEPLSR